MIETLTTRMRVNRVEYWRPRHADGGPLLTQIEIVTAHEPDQPRLCFEHQADGQSAPTRLVVNLTGRVALEPGDYLDVTLAKAAPVERRADREEIPF